jgi:hypothetical protein
MSFGLGETGRRKLKSIISRQRHEWRMIVDIINIVQRNPSRVDTRGGKKKMAPLRWGATGREEFERIVSR